MEKKSFSIFESRIRPRMIIEASAGTGKTYTIAGLVIRLILEEKIPIDKLLVVTFTRMATKELKDRILRMLREVYLVLLEGTGKEDNPFLADVYSYSQSNPGALSRIKQAIRNFDEANIITIHGFCQLVLSEETILTGTPPDIEVIQTDDHLIEASEDFWRKFVYEHSSSESGKFYLSKIMKFGETPDELLQTLRPLTRHLDAEFEGYTDIKDPVEQLLPALQARRQMQKLWMNENESIIRELLESDVKFMTSRNVKIRATEMDNFVNDPAFTQDTFGKLVYFLPEYHSDNLKKKGTNLPDHSFFNLCERYTIHAEEIPKVQSWFLKWAAGEIWNLREMKREECFSFTYDDLLIRVYESLRASQSGERLAQRLRAKYPVALVDEFQDTDNIQYDILDRIYSDDDGQSTLLMIGDPKQAIYSFRGADLYTYLKARNRLESGSVYTLRHNFRSTPQFISACNRLFDRSHASPFLEKKISYTRILPGGHMSDTDYTNRNQSVIPVPVYYLKQGGGKNTLKTAVFTETARQIRDMIIRGRKGELQIRDATAGESKRNLKSGDITVLVYTNKDASHVKRYLQQNGIGAVIYSREKVFETSEARRLEQLFSAVLDPSDSSKLITALSTGFFGHNVSMLYRVQSDEDEQSVFRQDFLDLYDIWQNRGVYPMVRKLLFEKNGLENIAKLTDSERIISNIQQLIDIAAGIELEYQFNPTGLLRWFRKKIEDAADNKEETLHLENDENLVKVSTIHNSKGLQFPVVFCPTLWEGRNLSRMSPDISVFHMGEDPYELQVNLDQSDSSARLEAWQKSTFEQIAEDVRKMYVAITRARYQCRIFWTDYSWSNMSGMGAMLSGKDTVLQHISDKKSVKDKNGMSPDILRGKIEDLSKENPGLFSFEEIDSEFNKGEQLTDQTGQTKLKKLSYQGLAKLIPEKKIFSFSSLQRNEPTSDAEPDYDQDLELFTRKIHPLESEFVKDDIFKFPRGKRAGTFMHKLFEHDDFDFRRSDNYKMIVNELLDDFGFDSRWSSALVRMLENVSEADFGPLLLNRVAPDDVRKEMQFHFPVSSPVYESIVRIIRGKRMPLPGKNGGRDYMTGFIDLILRQDDVYYLIDYKSNLLGNEIQDYQGDQLREEMEQAGYDVQYHIYVVALLKYLRQRMPGFTYNHNFGGIYYLFVRGIRKRSNSGIYYHKPEIETIRNLEKLMERWSNEN